jgi:uncharacterized cupin superfamily protein
MERPEFIKHVSEIQRADDAHYRDSDELLGVGAPFGKTFGLTRLGIHHVTLLPGRRTSFPHAEKTEEEFVYVVKGHPHVWIDGALHALRPGDGVGFKPGTGVAHAFLNDSDTDVELIVVGDTDREDNRITYPVNPERRPQVQDNWWPEAETRVAGSHDGLTARRRQAMGVEAFVTACIEGDVATVARMLDARATLVHCLGLVRADHREFMAKEDADAGWTPLHLAAHYGQLEVVKLLVARGADVNAVARNGIANRPLGAAEAGSRSAVVAFLKEHGARP